eukprot:1800963-Alexandrium_andersonii.AAC.1
MRACVRACIACWKSRELSEAPGARKLSRALRKSRELSVCMWLYVCMRSCTARDAPSFLFLATARSLQVNGGSSVGPEPPWREVAL